MNDIPEAHSNAPTRKVIIAAIALLALGGAVFFFAAGRKTPQPTFRVDPPSLSAVRGPLYQLKAYYDPDGTGKTPEEEVTAKVAWSTEDPTVVAIGDADQAKGQVMTLAAGSTAAIAAYQNLTVRVRIDVAEGPLVVQCEPLPSAAKVGERVAWWALFVKPGVPDYEEVWKGSDGLKGVGPVVYKTYSSPGTKKADVTVVDKAGSTVHAECRPLDVK